MRNQYKVLEEKYEVVQEAILKPDQEFNYWKDRIKTVVSSFNDSYSFTIEDINNALNKDSNSIVSVSFEDLRNHNPGQEQAPSGVFQTHADKPRIYIDRGYLNALLSREPRVQKNGFNALLNVLYHELVHLYQYFWIKGFTNRDQNKYLKNYNQDKNEIMAWAAYIARYFLNQVQNDKNKAIKALQNDAWMLNNQYPEPVKKKILKYTYDYINHLSRNTGEGIQTPVGIQTT